MTVQEAAVEHYQERRTLVASVIQAVVLWWAYLNRQELDESWLATVRPGLVELLTTAQNRAAAGADAYLDRLDAEWGLSGQAPSGLVVPEGFAGAAADQRPLESLLDQSFLRTKVLLAAGSPMEEALRGGMVSAQRVAVTETQDAGRGADQAAIVARPQYVGYYRYLQLPSCDRCVVLAGRWYKWSDGFDRHDRCDCEHVAAPDVDAGREVLDPATIDPTAAVRSGQVSGLSAAERRAILEEGADLGRIVNAKRSGLRTAGGPARRGRKLSTDAIYRMAAGSREEAVRLLAESGYIVPTSG